MASLNKYPYYTPFHGKLRRNRSGSEEGGGNALVTAGTNIQVTGAGSTNTVNSYLSQNLLPVYASTIDLGSSSFPFENLYLNGTINGATNLVSSVNTLVGDVVLAAGANITLTPSGNTITIASPGGGGGSGVSAVNSLTGNITLAAGAGLSVNTAGSTVTYANTGVLSAKITGGSTETGAIVLNPGTGVTITDSPAGTFTFANSGILSVAAGSGVSAITTSGATTISNTGVLSALAGTGIGLSGSTGNITITNNGVTSLNTLAGALTLAAGSNITLTPSGGNTITIASTGGGGGGGSVSAGTNIQVTGSAPGTVNSYITSDVFPQSNGTVDLGTSPSNKWRNGWFANVVNADTLNMTSALQYSGSIILNLQGSGGWAFGLSCVSTGSQSLGWGDSCSATSTQGIALGCACIASGSQYSTAIGQSATASANGAIAIGQSTAASGPGSIAIGISATAQAYDYAIAIGSNAVASTAGTVSLGAQAGAASTSSSAANTFIGYYAGCALSSGGFNTITGWQSFTNNVSGSENSAYGSYSLVSATSGPNDAFGFEALYSCTTGTTNTAFGNSSGKSLTTANDCTFVGYDADTSALTSPGQTCIGSRVVSTGGFNTLLGFGAYGGDYCIAIGQNAGTVATTASSSIFIGNAGLAPDNNLIRIGYDQVSCYIAGIYGTTVSGSAVYVNSSGQLAPTASSKRFKENDRSLGDAEVQNWLAQLRPVSYNEKEDHTKLNHYGLIAEEVEAIEGLRCLVRYDNAGLVYNLDYIQLMPVLIKAVQFLLKKINST